MYLSFTLFISLYLLFWLFVKINVFYYFKFLTSFYHFPFFIIIQLIFGFWNEGKILLVYEQNDQEFH